MGASRGPDLLDVCRPNLLLVSFTGNVAMFAGDHDDIAQTAACVALVASQSWRAWDLRSRR
jgi:hypothetical protein